MTRKIYSKIFLCTVCVNFSPWRLGGAIYDRADNLVFLSYLEAGEMQVST